MPRLSEEEKNGLEIPFSEEELRKALGELNANKAPGTDGIPPEYYRMFWHLLARYYCQSLDYSIQNGRMTDSQKRGIITLVPKKDVDRRRINNWRPITLRNADYKIYTKALALRIQRVIVRLVTKNQTGFLPGRFIGDSVRAAEDALEIIQEEHPGGMLVALDFNRAFDSVRWSLIMQAIQILNFGEAFIDYVKILFVDIQSCLYNAGRTSETFNPGRGVRQGCPVPPSIFLLVAEILANLIRDNDNIIGVKLGNSQLKLAQFADDDTCFLTTEESLPSLLSTLDLFAKWSGLTVNTNKTKIICPKYLREGKTHIRNMPIKPRYLASGWGSRTQKKLL